MTARVLIVDDIPANVRLMEVLLEAQYYEVKAVLDGAEAALLAESWQPDVILLDVMMPGMDGYQLCKTLKTAPATAHIPVIMVTALTETPDRLRALSCGADEFLSKPVEHEILLARLRGILRLKSVLDEWRARGQAALALGLMVAAPHSLAERPRRALIVDDLMIHGPRLRAVLQERGIECGMVKREPAALAASEEEDFDLIIINLSLLADDPLRLMARLRSKEVTRNTPILLLADAGQRNLVISALNLGANDCIMLPFDDSELLLRADNHIRRKIYQDRLRIDLDSALQMSVMDALTGLYNRRYLDSHLEGFYAHHPAIDFAILMIDIDHFKLINDRHGHRIGDEVLRAVADALRRDLRQDDLIARYGGEEFVVVVKGIDETYARELAEQLRMAIEQVSIETVQVTASIGIAISARAAPRRNLIELADQAMYQAKRHGRNRVIAYSDVSEGDAPLQSLDV